MKLHTGIVALMMGSGLNLAHAATQAADIEGYWRTIDDKTGFAKAIIQIYKAANGTYSGVHIRAIPRPNYVAKEYCQNCPPPFKDQKIVGMQIIWHLKPVDNFQDATWQFVEGYALDPLSGKIYRGRAKLSADHRRLTLRGYVGISALGRSQTWIREDADSQYLKDLPNPPCPRVC